MFGNKMAAAECEFVFKLKSDLAPRKLPYSRDEVLNAVESLHPGLELPDSRFADFAAAGGPQLAADNACTHWMVIGEPTDADWRSVDLSQHKTYLRVDGVIATQGTGADVLGDPRDALTWLANNTNAQGDFLRSTIRDYRRNGATFRHRSRSTRTSRPRPLRGRMHLID